MCYALSSYTICCIVPFFSWHGELMIFEERVVVFVDTVRNQISGPDSFSFCSPWKLRGLFVYQRWPSRCERDKIRINETPLLMCISSVPRHSMVLRTEHRHGRIRFWGYVHSWRARFRSEMIYLASLLEFNDLFRRCDVEHHPLPFVSLHDR